jgi:hypothetical protein
MSLRKPMAALAAVTAALALAVPVTSASAAPAAPAVPTPKIGFGNPFAPGGPACQVLYSELSGAFASGNVVWANVLSNWFVYSGCGGAAI